MMRIMFSPEDLEWHKWAALVYRRSRSKSYGHDGKPVNR